MDNLEADLSEGLHGVQISVDLTIVLEDDRGGGGLLQWRQFPTTVSSSSSIFLILLLPRAPSQPGRGACALVDYLSIHTHRTTTKSAASRLPCFPLLGASLYVALLELGGHVPFHGIFFASILFYLKL